ncbi:chemotaxis protein CheD [Orenia marismortui]|uniref:Probable chemoreceptor glutamine deamidase CheD n=1 Tax=Orenia marismortui TaxID=46469 RepID=A0A4R8GPW1_9FIRM|nr:chemotaxis protein CheD [Orenia marismortui]TDX47820.1 chemotaxis protein CheD [Orenia marismortui]
MFKDNNLVISTLLGSCVAVCLLDSNNSIYGINHFMLPAKSYSKSNNNRAKYGVDAIALLLERMIYLGANSKNLKAKIFGGGQVAKIQYSNIALENIKLAREILSKEKIPIIAEDVGGNYGRQIYFCAGGSVYLRKIKNILPKILY